MVLHYHTIFETSNDIVSNKELTLMLKLFGQIHYDVTDKKNNVSYEGFDTHYH